MFDDSKILKEHYLHPRNVGELTNPDGFGEVGNVKCGDALRLSFNLDDQKRISEIKFKTFGCGSAVASASILTEMCLGLTVEEAACITNDDIAQVLEGVSDAKMHCSALGQEALAAAIAYYKNGGEVAQTSGTVICACFNVTKEAIVEAIKSKNLTTVQEVTRETQAGAGCGACLQDIEDILLEVRNEGTLFDDSLAPKVLSTLEKIDLIRSTIEQDIRPVLLRDGGDCTLLDIEDNRVTIKFIGACSTCSYSPETSKELIEKTLKEKVSENLVVVVQ